MTLFGSKLYALKPSRHTPNGPMSELTIERIRKNQTSGIETNFLPDNNLLIELDKACESERPATDATLKSLNLLEWVNFLRKCDKEQLYYSFSPFFGYAEMPANLAQIRTNRLGHFAKKFGFNWFDDPPPKYSSLGRMDPTFEGLEKDQQLFMSVPFSALLLMLLVNRDGAEFSPIDKFRRYIREYKRLIGIVSIKEITIARYVFATQADCPGALDQTRSRIEKNFARNKKNRHPIDLEDMCTTALNGAFDLVFLNVINVADTKGVNGHKLDCWLFTFDGKLKSFLDICFNASLGTDQAGLFTVLEMQKNISDYWDKSEEILCSFLSEGSMRVLNSIKLKAQGEPEDERIQNEILKFPDKARAVIDFAKKGF